MKTEAVPEMRSAVAEHGEELWVATPTRRQWFIVLFGLPFFLVWLPGEQMLLLGFLASLTHPAALLSSLAWLAVWSGIGAPVLVVWLWALSGKERIVVGRRILTHRYEIWPGIGRQRDYDLTHVRRLRAVDTGGGVPGRWPFLRVFGLRGGAIAFDYGARTVRIGSSMDEAEGKMLVIAIERHLRTFEQPADTGAGLEDRSA